MGNRTFVPIQSITLGSAAASVEFTSIPAGYRDLVVVVAGGFATNTSDLRTQFNGDTGTNYSNTDLRGNGTAAASSRTSNVGYIQHNSNNVDATSIWTMQVMSYANTSVYTTVLSEFASAGTGVERSVGLWRSTSAVTSILIYTSSGNLSAGLTATLYGIGE